MMKTAWVFTFLDFVIDRFNINLIKALAPEYLKELDSLVSGTTMMDSVLRAVAYAVSLSRVQSSDADQKFHEDLRGKRLIARVRHFIDLWGYSLSRHHDSRDTLCALIVPIFPYYLLLISNLEFLSTFKELFLCILIHLLKGNIHLHFQVNIQAAGKLAPKSIC